MGFIFPVILFISCWARADVDRILKSSLESNVVKLQQGFFMSAGQHQFKSLWTRDFCMSVRGLLAIGRADVVKNQLDYLISHRRQDNLVPLYVDSMNPVYRVIAATFMNLFWQGQSLPIDNSIKPYYLVNGEYEVADSNILVLYAAREYWLATKDEAWFRQHKGAFREIFDFYKTKLNNSLVVQGEHADWQDSSKRKGKTFFTNLIYYHMGRDYGFLNSVELENTKDALITVFYDKKTGLFKSIEGRDNISLDGILWAIDHGLLLKAQDLYEKLKQHPLFTQYDIPGFATYPSYGPDDMYLQVKLVGLNEYHGNLLWSWLIAYAAKVAFKQGDKVTFGKIQSFLHKSIELNQTVFEIYENSADHKPFNRLLYRSESPFSWGTAFILDLEKVSAGSK